MIKIVKRVEGTTKNGKREGKGNGGKHFPSLG